MVDQLFLHLAASITGRTALSSLVPAAVSSVSSLAKTSVLGLKIWALHGLLLTIEAAGLSFVSHVKAALGLALDILLTEKSGWINLSQGIGHFTSGVGVDTKIAGFVLEMWYWWHSVLWKNSQIGLKGLQSISEIGNCWIPSASMLIQPVKTATVTRILENAFSVKDYPVQSMKLLSASRHLWKSSQSNQEMPGSLLSIVRSLFQQMVYAHQKLFKPEMFVEIKSAFYAIEKKQNKMNGIQFLI